MLPLHGEALIIDNRDAVYSQLHADVVILKGLVADVEDEVRIVWTDEPQR